jgi:hypothetical protein
MLLSGTRSSSATARRISRRPGREGDGIGGQGGRKRCRGVVAELREE